MAKNKATKPKKKKKPLRQRHEETISIIQQSWYEALKEQSVTHSWIVRHLVSIVTNQDYDQNAPSRISALDKLAKLKGEPPPMVDVHNMRSMAEMSDAELDAMIARGEAAEEAADGGDS